MKGGFPNALKGVSEEGEILGGKGILEKVKRPSFLKVAARRR